MSDTVGGQSEAFLYPYQDTEGNSVGMYIFLECICCCCGAYNGGTAGHV